MAQRKIDSTELFLRRDINKQKQQLLSSVLKFILGTIWRAMAVRFKVILYKGWPSQDMMEGAGLEKNPTKRKLRRYRLSHKSLMNRLQMLVGPAIGGAPAGVPFSKRYCDKYLASA